MVHVPDLREDPEYVYLDAAEKADYRSVLSVPMLHDGQPIGAITVSRAAAKPFLDAQVKLLTTFADQAVIAIENVRLFKELESRNGVVRCAARRTVAPRRRWSSMRKNSPSSADSTRAPSRRGVRSSSMAQRSAGSCTPPWLDALDIRFRDEQ